ncbi:MAG: hypothetical protein NTU98_10105 [Bacteroidetes bacterium]|nr:hypothetical protein [Bacteroidota bacterium]
MKKDSFTKRMDMLKSRSRVPKGNLLSGSIADKYPVILDGGRTVIFVSDKSKEAETRANYALLHTR